MVACGFAEGTTPACRMARRANCKLIPVDMGIKDFSPQPGVLNRRVANGTGDISKRPGHDPRAGRAGHSGWCTAGEGLQGVGREPFGHR